MTNEPELLSELVKTNETLSELRNYARFSHNLRLASMAFAGVILLFVVVVTIINK